MSEGPGDLCRALAAGREKRDRRSEPTSDGGFAASRTTGSRLATCWPMTRRSSRRPSNWPMPRAGCWSITCCGRARDNHGFVNTWPRSRPRTSRPRLRIAEKVLGLAGETGSRAQGRSAEIPAGLTVAWNGSETITGLSRAPGSGPCSCASRPVVSHSASAACGP